MSKLLPNPVNQVVLGPTTNPIMNPPETDTAPTHPLNPMPTPKPLAMLVNDCESPPAFGVTLPTDTSSSGPASSTTRLLGK